VASIPSSPATDPGSEPLDLPAPSELFPAAAGYLNTASLGLPPASMVEVLHQAVDQWAAGAVSPPDYDQAVGRARESFARLTRVPVDWVAVAGQVSSLVGLVAAWLPPGSQVLGFDGDFTSVLFPFLARRDLQVRLVPLADLAAEIGQDTRLVVVSAVQSSDGAVADLGAIRAAADEHGARVLVDGTQAVGWLTYDAGDIDVHVVGAYKWMLSPRGTSFASIHPDLWDQLPAVHAGWYAGEHPWQSIYGHPLRLASNARRFDLSPAWLSWVGTAQALDYLEAVGVDRIHRHDVGLASLARQALDRPPSGSAMVSLPLRDGDEQRLARAGVGYAMRDGQARFSFHLYNTHNDVDRLVSCLRG
jgi:selenocysteine lyase/cysteine desulfurase